MSADAFEKAVFVCVGWLLSTVTGATGHWVARRRETRRVFTNVFLMCESVICDLALTSEWRKHGLLETCDGMLDLDNEEARRLIPPAPPTVDGEFPRVLADLSAWEASRGRQEIARHMRQLEGSLSVLDSIHRGLLAQAQAGKEHVSERAVKFFGQEIVKIDPICRRILSEIEPLRSSVVRRVGNSLKLRVRRLGFRTG